MADILDTIKQIPYDEKQYHKATYEKNQIVLHHTISNGSAQAVVNWWELKPDRVGTPIIIEKDGKINQIFSSRYYAGHVGNVSNEMKAFNLRYRSCSKNSIGVELINGGGLVKMGDNLYDAYGHEYKDEVEYYSGGYNGFKYFPLYTKEQIESLRRLLIYWCNRYDIPTEYHEDIWKVNKRALIGEKGIYVHGSFRFGKSDLHPQPELIEMLKNL